MNRHYAGVEAMLSEALRLAEAEGDLRSQAEALDQTRVPESLFHLGLVHQVLRRDWDASIPLFHEALSLAEPDGDVHLRGELHRHVGFHVLLKDRLPDEALPHFQTSLELWRSLDRSGWVVAGLVALARCESLAGRHGEAVAHSREALELARQEGLRRRYVTSAEEMNRIAEAAAAEHA